MHRLRCVRRQPKDARSTSAFAIEINSPKKGIPKTFTLSRNPSLLPSFSPVSETGQKSKKPADREGKKLGRRQSTSRFEMLQSRALSAIPRKVRQRKEQLPLHFFHSFSGRPVAAQVVPI
jgi:hypothetical protein